MLKKFLVGTFAVAALALAMTVSAAYDFGTTTLKVGSKGEAVKTLQTLVGVKADGSFGPMTKTAVIAWQKANGLTADGLFGKMSMAKANGGEVVVTPSTGSTTLSGGAGDLTIDDSVSKDEESSLKEGEEDVKVVGVKLTAEDSDISVTSAKIVLTNSNHTAGDSEKVADYLSEVKVFLGSKEVGSMDVSDFSKTAGTWDEFTKSINLSGAVVSEDDSEYLHVAVSAIDDIDSDDISAVWSATIEALRYTDGTGAVMSADSADLTTATETFGFTDSANDDRFDIKSSSSNPDAATVKILEDDSSDEILVGVYKMDVDEDSSDLSVLELPINVTVSNNSVALDSIEDIIDTLSIRIDGKSYEADVDTDLTASATTGTATYLVEFDSDEMVIDAGDVLEVKVYATFAEEGNAGANYTNGTDVVFAVDADAMDIENEDEDSVVDGKKYGSFTSESFNLSTDAATINGMKWVVSSTGSIVDFFFTVKAEDEAFDVLLASITANDSVAGTATVSAPTLTRSTGDSVESISGGYTVAEGDETTFRARYDVTGANGTWAEITITSVAGQAVADDDQVSPTATRNVAN
jgi:peptidoglycan hydrolase-like protein with peptidoglycan-binding domain